MKNTFGNSVAVTLFGESHGEYIGAVIDGLAPGIEVNDDYIKNMLTLRRPQGKTATARVEADNFKIVSGVINNKTTGTPITILIPNENVRSADYSEMSSILRPSHADYTAECKYKGFEDSRGGGHFSGRITAALVAAGAICKCALEQKGIYIGTHVGACAEVKDIEFSNYLEDIKALNQKTFAVLSDEKAEEMKTAILKAAEEGDSVGGILETAVVGMPTGVGEPWFDTIEGMISHAVFSIPAIKGIEFGLGFAFADKKGSEANDSFKIEGDKIVTATNNNGGINGGITNGMPIIFRTVVKPTPTIFKEQNTVNIKTMTETVLTAKGRHDPAIVHRARVVQDAVTALVLADALALRFGTDWIK